MSWAQLIGRRKWRREPDPPIPFGRYSDNNKTAEQVQRWKDAETLFREGKYLGALDAFFEYLHDAEQQNLIVEKTERGRRFLLYQGSKLVRGEADTREFRAKVALVRMPEPSIPVMRRLLEQNFHLYYSRYALRRDIVLMRFNTDARTASPNRLYYGLKELATRADKQDDLLLEEFGFLQPVDNEHLQPVGDTEKAVKYSFLQEWVRSALQRAEGLDGDRFSGGISYMLLATVFRIDYLIMPEGRLLSQLEDIAAVYYGKDAPAPPDRNLKMTAMLRKLLDLPKQELDARLFRSRYSFAIVPPHDLQQVKDAIGTSLQNMVWYRDNHYPDLANSVMEYGFSYCQYSYSLPRPLSELYLLFMRVNLGDFFRALGFTPYYEPGRGFHEDLVRGDIAGIVQRWKSRYPKFDFRARPLRFESLLAFNQSFLKEILEINLE